MKKNILKLLSKIVLDILFGIFASIFMYILLVNILPCVFNGLHAELGNAGIKINLFQVEINPEWFKKIFTFWNNFCILFGARFIVSYLTGNYNIE